jgi:hypothetical protein
MKRVSVTIVLAALALQCEGQVTINSKYEREYTTTVTRAVGPTTLTGARGTLPQPTPTDLNSVYLAPNGSDAGADGAAGTGIAAAPVLTPAKAIAVMAAQPSRNTMVIIRNGYVGELLFSFSSTVALATGDNIQVEDGEYAVFEGLSLVLTMAANSNVNGLWVDSNTGGVNMSMADGCSFANSMLTGYRRQTFGQIEAFNATASTDYSVYGSIAGRANATTRTISITNCVLRNYKRGVFTAVSDVAITASTISTGTMVFNIDRTYIYNSSQEDPSYVFRLNGSSSSTASTFTLNFDNCVLIAGTRLGTATGGSNATLNATVAFNNCQENAGSVISDDASPLVITLNDTVTSVGAINTTLPRMLVDESGYLNTGTYTVESASLLRLQIEGKATPSGTGRYLISSPLAGAGLAGVDVNPWDESTVLTSAAYAQSYTFAYPPRSFTMTSEPVNPVTIYDTLGNAHNYNDGLRRRLAFTWGDTQAIPPDDLRKFNDMLGDRGTVQIYPLPTGVDGNLWTGDDTLEDGALVASGATATFTPTSPSPQMIDRNWAGWWLEVVDGSTSYVYYIASNTNTVLNLVDKDGIGFPASATYDFAIRFILATFVQNPVAFVQSQDYTQFLHGGRWRETSLTMGSNAYAYTGETIEFYEAEDNEEIA